jgi:small multidrug resistance pump
MDMSWLKVTLRAAGAYNTLWGAWVICFPGMWWEWMRLQKPIYPQLWQCLGMVVGVYGIGYWLAARDPLRHWVIVLVGFLGKVLGPVGAVIAVLRGLLPARFLWMNVTNDLIWWVPFGMILWRAWRAEHEAAAKKN